MTVATALVSGNDPLPQLAEEAVSQALKKAGLTHANGVLLFLTPDFARHAQQSVTAAARSAQCTQIAGGIAAGVFTEDGWILDRPAVAAMVFGRGLSLGHPGSSGKLDEPVLSYTGSTFPPDWSHDCDRFGGSFTGNVGYADPVAWQQSRLTDQQRCSVQLLDAHVSLGVSSGLHLLGDPQCVERSTGYDLEMLGGLSAQACLQSVLPPEYWNSREQSALPLQHLTAVLIDNECSQSAEAARTALANGRYHPVAIIATNADHSLTLAERTYPGQQLAWAIRQPLSTEADMRHMLTRLSATATDPACALMFSCIGRGPYFYGGEDRDLTLLREQFPNLPLLGTYGTSQIAPIAAGKASANRQLQNAVVTALVSKRPRKAHVQSIT
jgi:small ligand-binding sensory domain FIST